MAENKSVKRWTKAEDKKILKAIKKSPENLHKAFMLVSSKIGRSEAACSQRWYSYISKSNLSDVNNICFAIVSKNKYAVNRKNPKEDMPKEVKLTFWQKICRFFSKLSE